LKEPYKKINDTSWIITVQEDEETQDLYIEFPIESLEKLEWSEGDIIEWTENSNGSWTLQKKQ
jgi:hypothetical protein